MTLEELKDLVAGLAVAHVETERLFKERTAEAERLLKERTAETERLFKQQAREADRRLAETARLLREEDRETDRQLRELRRQIAALGDKFGGFTEGMAFPSMKRILKQRFGMGTVAVRVEGHRNGHSMEIDVLASGDGGSEAVYVVEVKSRLRAGDVQGMLRKLRRFPEFFPAYRGKRLYGILAAVDVSEELRRRVLANGLYLARIHDDTFELDVPEDFQPRAFEN